MPRERKIFIKSNFRHAFSLFIILNIPYLLALGSALYSYKGTCQGFLSDYSSTCKFGTFVSNELIPASFISIIPVLICVALWGGAVGKYCRFKLKRRGVKYSVFNFLPFGGAIMGLVFGFFVWLIYPQILHLIITY